MNILVDSQHHPALDESIELLFHDRLGHNVFRPIGLEWAGAGVWRWAERDGGMPWIEYTCASFCNPFMGEGIYKRKNEQYPRSYNYITFEGAKNFKIDMIISTLRAHDVQWLKYIKKYQTGAKLVAQIGDISPIDESVKYILCSIPGYIPAPSQKLLYYNQEFDIKNIFYYEPYKNYLVPKIIRSFIHYIPAVESFVAAEKLFLKYEMYLSNYKFYNHSKTGRDGFVTDMTFLGRLMRESLFGWQVKPIDGYGHNFHNWLAVGRPVIINSSTYKHHSNLLIPGQSCIDVDAQSFERTIDIIKECSEPSIHKKMCEETYKIFKENINFDVEASKVKEFIENVR
jgi:hypothetical protein